MVGRMVSRLARCIHISLRAADAVRRPARQWLDTRDTDRHRRHRRFLDHASMERRAGFLERASGDQRGRRAGPGDASQCLGHRLARAKAADRLEQAVRGAWRTDTGKSGEDDAVLQHRIAHGVLALVPDAFLYGRRGTLSFSRQHYPLEIPRGKTGCASVQEDARLIRRDELIADAAPANPPFKRGYEKIPEEEKGNHRSEHDPGPARFIALRTPIAQDFLNGHRAQSALPRRDRKST